jgi:N12 class adenine-specific DNA methylase
MATKLQFYSTLAERTLNDLTAQRGNWMSFLDTAARLYKYPFQDQLMIYSQRPDATACAELEFWNEHFNRWVRRGSKGIALIDDSGNYPRLKYVFDVNDTEPSLYRARPVQLWEMRQEHKAAVMAELAKSYEDISADDSLADTFHNIAMQLAREYYEDNYRELVFRAENSVLEPSSHYDFAGTVIEQADDSSLRAVFEEALANSVAYTVMIRCGLDPDEYFDGEDFQNIIDFNTPDMINALGVAAGDLSKQVLRDIELTIRKYERTHTAERSENNHDRNLAGHDAPNLHADRGLSSSRHQTERTAEGTDGAARQVRENEESVPQRTPGDNVQPPAAHGEIVPAPAGSGRSGDGEAHTDDGRADGTEQPARQGERPDGLDGGDERAESAGRGNSPERTDLRIEQPETGAATEAAPFSMAELAQYHSDWNEYIINSVSSDGAVLNAAVNMDKRTTLYEIVNSIKYFHAKLNRRILDSSEIRKGELWRELDNYISKDRTPTLAEQLYDTVIRSDTYKERVAAIETPSEQETSDVGGAVTEPAPQTYSQLGNSSIKELLSGSTVSLDEVDAILRDGGNFYNHRLDVMPFASRSALRIAAHFAKGLDDNADYLKGEYLTGGSGRGFIESGKGFDFGNHRVCAWFDKDGISLAIGTTAKHNIHKATIPWELAAARVDELLREGRYVSRAVFDEALNNERLELADKLWFFYRDDMGGVPDEWSGKSGGHPGDVAVIKSLLDDDDERQAICGRLEVDVDAWLNDDTKRRSWNDPTRLLDRMNDAMNPPVIFPNDDFTHTRNFSYFITQDEIDALLTHGGSYTEGKLRFLSFFLGDHNDKEKLEFVKREYGHGGGTWSQTDGWENAEPGKGLTIQRGGISKPDTEVTLKWNAVIKRTEQLIASGHYATRAELDSIPNYERLMLVRKVNGFYYNLPEEYERPFPGKTSIYVNEYRNDDGEKILDFHYPHEAEWQAVSDLLDNPERVDTVLAQMRYIFENTSTDDRHYGSRKEGFEALYAYKDGTYTLFPGIENLPEPGTPMFHKIGLPDTPRREMVEDLREPSALNGFGTAQSVQQLTLFDVGLPVLPSVDEQRERIDQKLQQEAENTMEAEVQTPAFSLPIDADEPLLNISDEDKTRIAAQFANNPRSREAVNLVREIYGDTLSMPLPQVVKRITELAAEGRFTVAPDERDPKEAVRELITEYVVSDELIDYAIDELAANGIDNPTARQIAERVEGILAADSDEPNAAPEVTAAEQSESDKPLYKVGDAVYLEGGKPFIITRISDITGEIQLQDPSLLFPIFRSESKEQFEWMLSMYAGNEQYLAPLEETPAAANAEVEQTPELPAPELDFDTVAQTVLARVMADADYAEALTNAKTRASLRNPCTWALEQSVRDHEQDEPEVYQRYFGDDDFNDNLFDFVLKQSWEQRPQPAAVAEQPPQYDDGFTEITDPAELAEIEAVFGNGKPKVDYIVGQRVILDLRSKHTGLIGEFHISAIDGDRVTVNRNGFTESIIAAEIEQYTVHPVAEKLYEELSPSGKDTTAYYLFQYPGVIDAGAVLSHETLALIRDRADTYIICAEACHLSENDLKQYNIGFRKMPRDWSMLPDTAKDQIRALRPEYERQWNELYGKPEQTAPRYIIKPVTHVEQISSNPRVVDLIGKNEQSTFHGIYDTQAERYLKTGDGRYIYFPTEKEALEYIEKLNAGIEAGTQNVLASRSAGINFRITDDHLGEGGAKTKFRNNVKALQTLKDIEFENRAATPEEQEILSRYVGWGGIQEAFDPKNKAWENEYLELNALLTPEEWESARSTTLYAHYTSPLVIKAIYETVERMGFKSGNILEPACGIGNFFGLLPESMRDSKLYGVEIDSVTARIAKQLYPKADIQQTGFEKTQFSDSFFDVAIGNVPFGGFGVIDKRYKTNFQIHDYFFQKTLDKVRPGGIVAFITSKGTLDKKNPEARKYLAQRAELLGAVRLPNNTFLKNAGTEVTTDILFFQKRDRPLDIEPDWVHLGLTDDELPINRYFLDNPEMMLGRMSNEQGARMYGSTNSTTCIPIEGADLAEQLKTALSYIQGEYTVDELDDLDGVDDHAIPADPNVKNFSYTDVDGAVYFRENSLMYPVDLPAMTLERIKGMIELRECVQTLIALQLDDYSDEEIKAQQAKLNTLYDGFIAEFGLISSTANSRAFNADSSYYLLSALEIINEDGELERKADMFTKRTVKQRTVITHVDTASEALAVSLGEKARVDLDYMSELTGFDREKLLDDLQSVVFLNVGFADSQEKAYVTADEYLSGNVREKLRQAEAAAKIDPSLSVNVEALKAIQPKDLEAGEIAVRLGSTWIDPKYVQQFMYELLGTSWRNRDIYQVKYHQYTGEWQVTGKGKSQFSDINATVTYGTQRMNAYQIIDDTLNLRDVRVYDYKEDADGKERRVLNKKETMLAQQKQEIIKKKFQDWIWQEPERRQTLVQQYNELFNSIRTREYDGSHITFDGMNPEIKLSKHQVDGAARHLYGGNALYAHVVGAGKTFTMIAAAMESKRLGLCQKSLFAVPNHLTEQWATEFLRLYPSANILVATKKDFEMRNRKKFCAKIATGDYDAVIIGHTQLEKIPMSRERQERQVREQIWEIEQGIRELKDTNGERFSIKQLEKTKRGLENRLAKLLDSKRRDDVVTFEQLGVDRLYVDEAHGFKNLFLYTKMRNVAGLSTSEAQKSSDLFMKCRYMDELTDNKGVIFATGTPISNSMSEMYTMQRYLQYDTLVAKRLTHFDSWASIFGETVTSIELAPEGTGYRARTRFAKFHNLPELMSLFKDVADIQTADMLDLPVPTAKYETVIVEPSELQKEMVQELSERAALVHNRKVDPTEDNMLRITTDGRKIGLDQRLINPLLPDFEGSKVNACTDKVFEIWSDTGSDRLTQLVFCDFSTPNKDGRFNVYDDIKAKLIERGIPEGEIAFIHDADTEVRKKELFAKVRQGRVRVLFGSTFKLGAGTNVQDKLIAIHDADCPWRPADLEQRSGRIIRQGNSNPEVKIFRYATSGTFDSYLWVRHEVA